MRPNPPIHTGTMGAPSTRMRTLLLVATLAMTHLVPLIAQVPVPQTPVAPPPAPPLPGTAVTVEGCVTRESALPQTAADAREPSAALQYVLTELTPPAPYVRDGSPRAAPTGATPSDSQQSARKIYVLTAAGTDLDFAPHLNHTVRVTGVSGNDAASAPSAAGAASPAVRSVPRLAVTRLEMMSSTCR
jgi:hypothetical protein